MRYELNFDAEPFEFMEMGKTYGMQDTEIVISGWTRYPDPSGIEVPDENSFSHVGSVGDPLGNILSRHQLGVYIIEIPLEIPERIRLPGPRGKRFYVGSAVAGPDGNLPGGLAKRIKQHRNEIRHYGLDPSKYKLHVWKIDHKDDALDMEEQIIVKNGGYHKKSRNRNPDTILTNEIRMSHPSEPFPRL